MVVNQTVLYGFWLSSCTWRVRAVLNLKRIPFIEKPVDIARDRMQLTEQYRAINPSQKVPALVIDMGIICVQNPNRMKKVQSKHVSRYDVFDPKCGKCVPKVFPQGNKNNDAILNKIALL